MNKLLLLLGITSFVYAEDPAAPVVLDAPASVKDGLLKTGGDDISNPSPAEETPKTHDEKFDMALSNMKATHPEKASEFKKAYHASKDKEKVLAEWSNTTIESQEMLDAVDELHAIYQVMKRMSPVASLEFERKVRDETDPRNLLEYAHQLLLKSLRDRKAQIESAKEELYSIITILQYVDIDAATDLFKDKQMSEDPRFMVGPAYEKLEESLEKAHKEAGLEFLE